MVHKTATFGSTDADPGQRFFYEVRNKVWTLRAGSSLAPAERVLYGGSTLRRWARTFAKSSDRATLRSCLISGLAAGVRTSPRPTGEVLASAGLAMPGAQETATRAAGTQAARLRTSAQETSAQAPAGPGSPPA